MMPTRSMSHLSAAIFAVTAITAATLTGCAKTKVDGSVETYQGSLPKPSRVIVHDFAYSPDQVKPSTAIGVRLTDLATGVSLSDQETALGEAVTKALSAELVKGLTAIGFDAVLASEAEPATGTDLEVEGQFVKIVEGNRLRRVVVGLGVGQSSLETHVQVYESGELGRVLATSFSTSGRGSFKPGVAETALIGPIAAGTSTAVGVTGEGTGYENATGDARRTAKLIVKRIEAMAQTQGWIDK